MTTDNSDLLGAAAPTVSAAKAVMKRAKAAKAKPADVVPASTKPTTLQDITAAGQTDAVITPFDEVKTEPSAIVTDTSISAAQSAADLIGDPMVAAPAEIAAELTPEQAAALDTPIERAKPVKNADGSVSVEIAPVSADYALAMATRIQAIGGKREYAYQRLLRAGKPL